MTRTSEVKRGRRSRQTSEEQGQKEGARETWACPGAGSAKGRSWENDDDDQEDASGWHCRVTSVLTTSTHLVGVLVLF